MTASTSATQIIVLEPDRRPRYPWRQIAVGESFFVPHRKPESLRACVWHMRRELRFEFRTISYRGVVGTKCTRVAMHVTMEKMMARRARLLARLVDTRRQLVELDADITAERLRALEAA